MSTIHLYEELISQVFNKKSDFSEQYLVLFSPCVGKLYENDLMIVGRATNDWHLQLDKENVDSKDEILQKVRDNLNKEDTQWVIDRWGNSTLDPVNNTDYNSKKSAFWRVSWKLAEVLTKQPGSVAKIVYSNLYKVAPQGDNPSEHLADIQFTICKDILYNEIELFKPKVVIFLTGWNWAAPFFKGTENLNSNSSNQFVDFVGLIGKSKIIVSKHPQGKPEDIHLAEILRNILGA